MAAIDDGGVDVVFLGEQTIQAWDGLWLDRPAPEGAKIAYAFNQTFNNPSGAGIKGLPLGIYGDRVSDDDVTNFRFGNYFFAARTENHF